MSVVNCVHCGKGMTGTPELAGQKVQCPTCHRGLVLPAPPVQSVKPKPSHQRRPMNRPPPSLPPEPNPDDQRHDELLEIMAVVLYLIR